MYGEIDQATTTYSTTQGDVDLARYMQRKSEIFKMTTYKKITKGLKKIVIADWLISHETDDSLEVYNKILSA